MNKRRDNKYGTVEVVKLINISPERLRYWEQAGILKPEYIQCGTRKFRRYSREDIQRTKYVKLLVDEEKYSLEGAIRKLKEKGDFDNAQENIAG